MPLTKIEVDFLITKIQFANDFRPYENESNFLHFERETDYNKFSKQSPEM